jgi:hypothetical protein
MKIHDIILPIIYFSISIWCFLLAMKGLKTRKPIFSKGTKGMGLENNLSLIWAQIIGTFFSECWFNAIRHSLYIHSIAKGLDRKL